jgi:5-deoxy-D-glucuronate isomerase
MDYDARKDSLLSEQESEKVEIYLSCRNVSASVVIVEVFLEEGNKPKKSVYYSKPTHTHHNKVDFANSLIIEYFFECNSRHIQSGKSFSFNYSTLRGPGSSQ